ncbi:NADH:flavin oxidoreductase [Clostridium tetani]|uniref:NAD(P)/FAD-dependent oxidoreductase n=1 Tax=Clostridium tetani TaxID=1513 RepID=UPI00100B7047|nr:NAD(P)/FAD-dependent oxidoreductase [Clostridium tetani]RXI40126.1 NADH:flavin oxidoreductase [Clostridium tetani]
MFKRLFSPITINKCEIPNRLAVTAMVSRMCNLDGTASEQYTAYHEERAKGGWGLIITEDYAVNENAMNQHCIAGLWNDSQIDSHRKFVETIHKYDSKVFCQMYHPGRQTTHFANGGVQPIAPSAIPCPLQRELPRELTIPEIEQLVDDFGNCALRAKKAGFDGIEIHAGHGYLIAEFLSPYANKRTDKYGGCFENRIRFLKEIYEAIRNAVGDDFPVIVRFSAIEELPGGRDMSESRALAMLLEEWGVDALDVSCSVYTSHANFIVSSMYSEHAWQVNYAEEIKKLVNIPVFTVNRINEPRVAESILAAGKADIIGMGRASLADPDLPNKAKAGQVDSIRQCIGCLQGCILGGEPGDKCIHCLVNPTLGFELEVDLSKAPEQKSVLIIGGGPGGMEAARVAAIKGHKVSLYEKNSFLGGQFKSAAYPPSKGDLATYTAWLIKELDELNVEIHLNTEITKQKVVELNPDVVIAATGGLPLIPAIKGIDKSHVHTAEDVLLGNVETGDKIVVAGGGEIGMEVAAHLGMQERDATIVEMLPTLGEGLEPKLKKVSLNRILDEFYVKKYTSTKVIEITNDGVVVENVQGQFTIPAQTVVLALGYKPNNVLAEELKKVHDNVIVIGGAVRTSNALVASREGFFAGMNIK